MITKVEVFNRSRLKQKLPDIRPGDTVRVYQKITETTKKGKSSKGRETKQRAHIFEGLVLARKHGKGLSATITVRKVVRNIGVERVFPLHSPTIEKIEILKRGKVRRAKLYYLRKAKGRKARLKRVELKKRIGLSDRVIVRLEKREEEKIKERTPQEKPTEEDKKHNETEKKTEN